MSILSHNSDLVLLYGTYLQEDEEIVIFTIRPYFYIVQHFPRELNPAAAA